MRPVQETPLVLTKMGNTFATGDILCTESDIGNYRVAVQFSLHDGTRIEGDIAPWRHRSAEGLALDLAWTDGAGKYWGHAYGTENHNFPYTRAGILAFVNSVILKQYPRVVLKDSRTPKNALFLLVGPSGAGKTSVAETLEATHGLPTCRSCTDRPPRGMEDKSHIFLSEAEFAAIRPNLLAYAAYDGHGYGVTTEMLDNASTFVVEPSGIREIKAAYQHKRDVYTILLAAGKNALAARMSRRGDNAEAVSRRLAVDAKTFEGAELLADAVIDASQPIQTVIQDVLMCMGQPIAPQV